MLLLGEPKPIVQRYPMAYYSIGSRGEHYVTFEGIRSRHASECEAQSIIKFLNSKGRK